MPRTWRVIVNGEVDADTMEEAWQAVLDGDWHAMDHYVLMEPDPTTSLAQVKAKLTGQTKHPEQDQGPERTDPHSQPHEG